MNKVIIKIRIALITMSLLMVSSCQAVDSDANEDPFKRRETPSIEQALQAAGDERRYHKLTRMSDFNSPLSRYTDKLLEVSNALNRAYKANRGEAFAQYLQALWDNDPLTLPKEYQVEINNPLVKIEVARLLGQAYHHCLIKTDLAILRDYVRNHILSDNKLVRRDAIFALSSVGNLEDIKTLSDIVKQEDKDYANEAISSLTDIGYLRAIEELKELETIVKKESLKKRIRFYLSSYGPGFRGFYYECGDNTGRNKDNLN